MITAPGMRYLSAPAAVIARRRSGATAPQPPWIFDGDVLDGQDAAYEGTLIVNATGGGDIIDGGGA
jgi:hypothetical protein